MNDRLNDKFIAAVKQRFSSKAALVPTLSEILSLSKESIFRRLRGDVPFSFDEAIKISIRLDISIDRLADASTVMTQNKWAVMDMEMISTPSGYYEQYCRRLEMYGTVFRNMQHAKAAKIQCAVNTLPYSFALPFETLHRFQIYKWSYLTQGVQPDFCFSKMEIPAKAQDVERRLLSEYRRIPRFFCILDKKVFTSVISDIQYFSQQGLISEPELQQLKTDLLGVITYLERITACGVNDAGNETAIYLSGMDLDATYIHMEYDGQSLSVHRTYFVDTFNFYNAKLCRIQKDWIELLKRYSMSITQSGEKQRFEYFNKQRELVEGIL